MKIFAFLLTCCFSLSAAGLPEVGDRPVPFALSDQFGKDRNVTATTKTIFYTPDKKATKIMEALLEKQPGLLEKLSGVYVADLSSVPFFVIRGYILPAWRDLPYPVLIIDDELSPVIFPAQLEHVTVMELENGVIRKIRYLASPEAF